MHSSSTFTVRSCDLLIRALLQHTANRKLTLVLVWKLDLWGRSLQHLVGSISELTAIGVLFISYKDNLDPAQPNGRLFLGMLGCLAEYEKELIRERTISGLEEARRRGVKLGRRPVNFDLARAKEMRSAGLSYASIAKALGVATGTIYAGLVSS